MTKFKPNSDEEILGNGSRCSDLKNDIPSVSQAMADELAGFSFKKLFLCSADSSDCDHFSWRSVGLVRVECLT